MIKVQRLSKYLQLTFCLFAVTARFFFKWANACLFFIYFHLFQHTLPFLQQINVKNAHPVDGAVIRTHNLWKMSLLP